MQIHVHVQDVLVIVKNRGLKEMIKLECNVKDCHYEFSRYGKFDIHEHKESGITHELRQWFCGGGHENWESKAW